MTASALRYRFYREHKYLSYEVSKLEGFIARVDFTDAEQVKALKQRFEWFMDLMQGHADHEDNAIHPLLKDKNPQMYEDIALDHKALFGFIERLKVALDRIDPRKAESVDLINQGYQFYLSFRKFVGINLEHLDHEETVIMPEIQKHYTDRELKELVEFKTYKIMTSDEMIDMMQELFPQMNLQDKEALLRDIQESEFEKFLQAWNGIALKIDEKERMELIKQLDIKAPSCSFQS
jgi:hemerythrin-like domain-containing protein